MKTYLAAALATVSILTGIGSLPADAAAIKQAAVSTLRLPNGHVLTTKTGGDSVAKWKDIEVTVEVLGVPAAYPYGQSITGNHSQIISHQFIHTRDGTAWFAFNEQTPPAAAKSKKVTYEYWVALKRKGPTSTVDYCIEATVIGNREMAKKEVLQLLAGWQVPKTAYSS